MKVKLMSVILLVMVLCHVTLAGRYRYSAESLWKAVKHICCHAVGKREATHEVERETASTFLISKLARGKRGLRSSCCSPYKCSRWLVTRTSLREECMNEGCYVEEIDELC